MENKRNFWRDNGLSLVMFGFFAVFLIGQSIVGWHDYNDEQQSHHQAALSLGAYLVSGPYWAAVFENWESEFLQMGAYVVLTAYLFQRGSSESKDPDEDSPSDEDPRGHSDDPNAPSPVKRGGKQLKVYENSLALALFGLFFLSFIGHSWGSMIAFNEDQREHGEKAVSYLQYLVSSRLWFESLQNWQSEFLAVFTLAVLSIKLRQKGSPESKPVAAPHDQTGD